ncbi:hypothetical protein [Ruminiclostridium papyrosolvens]|uniref:Uncharacterized protein n=1 Tax=Ruminiclostridium papyrosolvens C7 TaxID=1330534 RepID=U4QZU9_9FIRM|nr:hypothetical protein [Ruminiclostridium papyrosolvens]EPR09575.1 hypothetical protein L323_16205 [Ruminiclostridium papyrosolvens C7]
MRRVFRTLGISIFNTIIIVIMLMIIVQLNLPMAGIYSVFAATSILYPAAMLLLYRRLWEAETLVIIPISLVLSALYSLGISMYSYYGTGDFSIMFKDLMYFIYFLPSIIYCIIGWIIFGVMAKMSKNTRRREF